MTKHFHVRTEKTDRLTFAGKSYTVASWKDGMVRLRRVDDRQLVETFDSETMRGIWDRNDFRYEPLYYSEISAGRTDIPAPTVSTLNARDKHILLYRMSYVEHWLALLARKDSPYKRTYASAKLGAAAIQPLVDGLGAFVHDQNHQIFASEAAPRKGRVGQSMVVDGKRQVEAINPPSGETLMKWLWTFQRAGGDPMSLKPDYASSGYYGSHLDPEVEAIITRNLSGYYLTLERPTFEQFLEKVIRDVKKANKARKANNEYLLTAPGMSSIVKAVSALCLHYVDTKRYGKEYADKAHPWNGDGLTINVPGQRVEIDAYEADVQTLMVWSGFWEGLTDAEKRKVRKKRLWLTVAIDRATRVILAMKLSKSPTVPNAISVLEMIESDKAQFAAEVGATSRWPHRCGVMTAVMDGAYVSWEMRAAMADARGTVEYPQAGDPKMRAVVERVFRTVATDLMARLSGKTFSDILQRADYDSEGNAGLTVDDLAWLLVTWVVDVYHNTEHSGLNGRTPNQAWETSTEKYGVHPWRDGHGRRSAFGVRVKRKLTGDGFEFLGNRYQDDTSDGLRYLYLNTKGTNPDREFELAIDLANLGAISVIIDEVAVMVPCRDKRMEGICAEDWIETCAALRAENAIRNEIPRGIAYDALDRIEARNASAGYRAGIFRQALSAEQLNKAEQDHFLGFRFIDEPEVTPSEILGHSIGDFDGGFFIEAETDVVSDAAVASAPPTPSQTSSRNADDWTMDD